MTYLGHRIDSQGLHPLPYKVTAVQEAPTPKSVSQLRYYLDMLTYYSKFLPNPLAYPGGGGCSGCSSTLKWFHWQYIATLKGVIFASLKTFRGSASSGRVSATASAIRKRTFCATNTIGSKINAFYTSTLVFQSCARSPVLW